MSKNNSLEQTNKLVEAEGLEKYLTSIGYEIRHFGSTCPRCGVRDAEYLFKHDRYKHETPRSTDYEYIYTWGYFECKSCNLVFIERIYDSSDGSVKK